MTCATDVLMSYLNICVHVCPSSLLQEQDGEIRAQVDDITGRLNGASHEPAGLSCHGYLYRLPWIPIYGFFALMSVSTHAHAHITAQEK